MTSSKPARQAGSTDLSIRARRFGLSPDEQRRFDALCEADATLYVAHQVGTDFDAMSAVQPGDEELIARTVDAMLMRPKTVRKRAWRGALAWGLAAALTTSLASAWWTVRTRHRTFAVEHAGTVDPPSRAAQPSSAIGSQGQPLPAPIGPSDPSRSGPSAEGTSDVVETPPPSVARTRAPDPSPTRVPLPALPVEAPGDGKMEIDAKEAFRRANAARRAGDLVRARTLYQQILTTYPGSDEASLSHVSLGKILLGAGQALEAERQFSFYLREGDRELRQEAWVGRAEGLARQGRAMEERQSWQALLLEFPASVYAARAKQRLEQLERP